MLLFAQADTSDIQWEKWKLLLLWSPIMNQSGRGKKSEMLAMPPDGGIRSGWGAGRLVGRFGRCAPACVLAVCSSVCSAWSRSFTSSSRASCSLLLFLFSFFSLFWIRTKREKKTPQNDALRLTDKCNCWISVYCLDSVFIIGLCAQPPLLPDLHWIFTVGRTTGALKALWDWNVCSALNDSLLSNLIKRQNFWVDSYYYY